MSDTPPPRPTFSNGQYIGADDLNDAVDYARDQTQRLAVASRDWGIATGLALVERQTTTGAVQMYIEPGVAWDGYGRAVVVINPAPVTPNLFAGAASGNQTVWLRYSADDTQAIEPGFMTCGAGDPTTRVVETYAIEVGSPTISQRTDGISIAGTQVADPRDMLIAVDQTAPVVLDGAAPHQMFPTNDDARWLIPVGIAAYTAGAPGSFTARTAAQLVQNRLARRYVGTVAESLLAADGVLRLRDRFTDQHSGETDDDLDAAAAIQEGDIAPNAAGRLVGNELVWVEGNMRVTGDARLFGTRLELRDVSGQEAGSAPEFLRRGQSINNTLHGQDLQIAIAGSASKPGVDRLAIGVVEPPTTAAPDGVLDELMVVRTDGRMAIGAAVANGIDNYDSGGNTLVVGTSTDCGITVVSDPSKTGHLYFAGGDPTAGFVSYDHNAEQMTLGAGGKTLMTLTAKGEVVIGAAAPAKFDASGDQFVISSTTGSAGLAISGKKGTSDRIDFANGVDTINAGFISYDLGANQMTFGVDATSQFFIDKSGQVGIRTDSPATPLEIASASDGHSLRLDLGSIQAMNGGSTSALSLQPNGDDLGVGLTSPQARTHVRAKSGAAGLLVDTGSATALRTQDGSVGIGDSAAPRTSFDVRASIAAGSSDPTNHVALIENTYNGQGNVLALQVGVTGAIPACNLLTFFDGASQPLAVFQSYSVIDLGYPGGYFNSLSYQAFNASDYAEAAPRAKDAAPIGPGFVVGITAGEVSKITEGADAVFVTTDRPAVLGNAPLPGQAEAYEILAFLGQVPVPVSGPVKVGDLILASGKADGLGRAVSPNDIRPDELSQVVGRAWQAASGPGPTRVNALVGPGVASLAASAALLERQARAIERQASELERQAREIERLSSLIVIEVVEETPAPRAKPRSRPKPKANPRAGG